MAGLWMPVQAGRGATVYLSVSQGPGFAACAWRNRASPKRMLPFIHGAERRAGLRKTPCSMHFISTTLRARAARRSREPARGCARCTARPGSRVDADAGRRAAAARAFARGGRAARPRRGRRRDRRSSRRCSAATRCSPGMQPYAARYGGHQFGNWAGQLGDGRAITLGEVVDARRRALGAAAQGRRPDAVLAHRRRPRRAALVGARVPVQRGDAPPRRADHARAEPGRRPARRWCATCSTTATRSPSRARSCAASRRRSCASATSSCPPSRGDVATARAARRLHDPHATSRSSARRRPRRALRATGSTRSAERTARMVAHWMRVGFVHGVMNTDNMSILGLTIDYGPYGWLDDYDPDWTPNTTDAQGRRYRFGHQPQIAQWNLVRLADALSPLFDVDGAAAGRAAALRATPTRRPIAAASRRKLGLRRMPRRGRRADARRCTRCCTTPRST